MISWAIGVISRERLDLLSSLTAPASFGVVSLASLGVTESPAEALFGFISTHFFTQATCCCLGYLNLLRMRSSLIWGLTGVSRVLQIDGLEQFLGTVEDSNFRSLSAL